MIPQKMFFTKGVGRHKERLQAFEMALRDAGIQACNLVSVSSILPPNCKILPKQEGLKELSPGQVTFVVMARMESNEPNRLIASSIGLAVPADRTTYGYISEHHAFGETEEKAGDYAEDLAATMLATSMGIEFDPNQAWDEKEKLFKMSGKILKTVNITQSAISDKNGLWTCTVSAVVFLP